MARTTFLRRLALISAVLGGLSGLAPAADAQTATPAAPAVPAPAPTVPATPSTPATPPAVETPPAAPAPDSSAGTPDKSPPDTSISQTLTLQPHPVIQLNGQATWDEGFKTLNEAFTKLNDGLAKASIKPTGNPMAVFTETDDAGFKFTAMVPVEKAPDAKPADLAADVSFGDSPGGKVMKFQHRSAYDDIDSTYEAITAYLDEKGLEAKNMFAEEYLNRTKSSDDNSLEVDIYVFLK